MKQQAQYQEFYMIIYMEYENQHCAPQKNYNGL